MARWHITLAVFLLVVAGGVAETAAVDSGGLGPDSGPVETASQVGEAGDSNGVSGPSERRIQPVPQANCSGVAPNTAVVYYETGERVGDTTLYPGVQLTVYLCADGEAKDYGANLVWEIANSSAYRVTDTGDKWVRLTLTTAGAEVSFGEQIQKRSATGPTVTVVESRRASYTDRANETVVVRFGSGEAASRFQNRSETLAAAHESLAGNLSAVPTNQTADSFDTPMTGLLNDVRRMERAVARLQQAAIPARRTGDTAAVQSVLIASTADETDARQRVRDRVKTYIGTVQQQRQQATQFRRLLLVGGLLGGLLIGAALGGLWGRRIRSAVIKQRGWDSDASLSLDRFWKPLAVGAVVGLAGLAAGAVLGGTALVEVIL